MLVVDSSSARCLEPGEPMLHLDMSRRTISGQSFSSSANISQPSGNITFCEMSSSETLLLVDRIRSSSRIPRLSYKPAP
jgi:hypothetical protein